MIMSNLSPDKTFLAPYWSHCPKSLLSWLRQFSRSPFSGSFQGFHGFESQSHSNRSYFWLSPQPTKANSRQQIVLLPSRSWQSIGNKSHFFPRLTPTTRPWQQVLFLNSRNLGNKLYSHSSYPIPTFWPLNILLPILSTPTADFADGRHKILVELLRYI